MADFSQLPQVPDYYGQFMAPLQRQQALNMQQQQVDMEKQQAYAQAVQNAIKARQAAAFQQDAASVVANPTAEGFQRLMVQHPEMHEGLKSAWESYSSTEKDREVKAASQVYAALQNGRSDLALSLLKDRKAAMPDDPVTSGLIDMIESGDPKKIKQAQGMAGMVLATATGADKIGSTLNALGSMDGTDKGQVVGRAIGHYENGQFQVDYRDPDAPQYREVTTTDAKGNPVTQIVRVGGEPAPGASGAGGFDHAVDRVLKHEGGYNPSDMNGKPVNFGINQGANPDLKVKDLTRDEAKQIYHDRYWVPSGAEQLPANLQAPYFDVYIRNPKFAKKALADSGGDPVKFMEISSSYFQNLAKKPSGRKYAEAWANRDADNMALASGGGVGPASAQPIYSAPKPTGEAESGIDPSTASFYAQQILAGGTMPALGMGKSAAAARQLIMKEVAKQAGAEGLTGVDLAKQVAHYQAGKKRIGTLETQFGTIQANEQTALANGQQFLDRSRELSGQTRFPMVNSVTQSYLRHTGDPTVAAMDAAWATFSSEYAKVVSGSPSGAGVLSDSARHEAMDIMRGNYSVAQKEKAFAQMKADMSNRIAAIQGSITNSYSSLTKQPGKSAPADGARQPPAGATRTATGPNGQKVALVNGRWVRY
jgi:hypothetical protein